MTFQYKTIVYNTNPIAKPRMTRRDKWQSRPCVEQYREYCDKLRFYGIPFQINWDELDIHFCIPMPQSWSEKKRREHSGRPHRQKPDIDNLVKAVFDALLKDDSHVYQITAKKVWGETGRVILTWPQSK